MTTSQALTLSEPVGVAAVPYSTLAYFRYRLKQRIFNAVLKEFKRSGLSKADLARRLDKDPSIISRLLAGPGNITLDTVSDILFATSGSELSTGLEQPLQKRHVVLSYYAGGEAPLSSASSNQEAIGLGTPQIKMAGL